MTIKKHCEIVHCNFCNVLRNNYTKRFYYYLNECLTLYLNVKSDGEVIFNTLLIKSFKNVMIEMGVI